MPKLRNAVPRYCKHRASGQAIVTLSGVDHYLGPHGTKTSRLDYDRLIAEWLAHGRRSTTIEPDEITVVELIAQFLRWSKQHYRKNGQPTGTTENHKLALSVLKKYYGRKQVREFGPKSLKAIQGILIKEGLSRRSVNDRIATIKQVFKFGASEELVNASVYQSLATVSGLTKGRSEAKRQAVQHESRVVPIQYGNRPGSNRTRKPKTKPGDCYASDSYRRAIHRVCDKLKIEKWSPNSLRHTAATVIRKQFGLEAAQVTLGHSKADVTQIYAEADIQKAVEVARKIG